MPDPSTATAVPVRFEVRDAVALITLDHPPTRNALTVPLLAALQAAAERAAADPDVRAVVIAGTGSTFAAGADLHEIQRSTPAENLAYNRNILDAFEAVAGLPVPAIAAITGHALGGGLELALACTMRIAAAGAKVGLPEVRLGLLPGAGATQRLPRLIGAGAAWRMLLTGEPVRAGRAHELGLVDDVAPDAEATLDAALELAGRIAAAAPLAVRQVLAAVREGADLPLRDGIDLAHDALQPLLASRDLQEGISAFLDRRPARFVGA